MRRQGYQNFIIPHSVIRLVLLERPGRASAELPSENAGSVSFNCGAHFHRIFFFFNFCVLVLLIECIELAPLSAASG